MTPGPARYGAAGRPAQQPRPRHERARETIGRIEPPLTTCEAVLTEACFLLRQTKRGVDGVLSLLNRGIIEADFRLAPEGEAVRRLMAKYANVPDVARRRVPRPHVGTRAARRRADPRRGFSGVPAQWAAGHSGHHAGVAKNISVSIPTLYRWVPASAHP